MSCQVKNAHHLLWFMLPLVTIVSGALGNIALAQGADRQSLSMPSGIVRLSDGRLLISDIESHCIFQLEPSGKLSLWGGNGEMGFAGDGGPVLQAAFNAPNDLKLDTVHNSLLIADSNNHRIRHVDLDSLIITTLAGNGVANLTGDHGPAIACSLDNPQGLAVDRRGNVLVADTFNHVVRRIAHSGTIETVAGSTAGLSGDGGPATAAQLSLPIAVAFDSDEAGFFVSDFGNSRIRRVAVDGTIETVCGIGKGSDDAGAGFAGDGESAKKAKIFSPLDVVVASPNCFYFSDSGNHRIRAVLHGVVISVAGSGHPSDFTGSRMSGIALAKSDPKQLGQPLAIPAKMAPAADGGLYFCDRGNRAVRLLKKDGSIETLISGTVSTTTRSK